MTQNNFDINSIHFDAQGLVPAVAQDATSGEILMLAWMDKEAVSLSLKTGYAHYYSRSRKRIWKKGESSGHVQEIREFRIDCDEDAILMKVVQIGDAACHTGFRSCFHRKIENNSVIIDGIKVFDPTKVY